MAFATVALLLSSALAAQQAQPFSQSYMMKLLKLNSAVSCKASDIDDWSCAACVHPKPSYVRATGPIQPYGTFGYVALWKGEDLAETIYLVFRGTCNLQNAIQDVTMMKETWLGTSCTDCKVHKGFETGWEKIRDAGMLANFKAVRAKAPNAPIVVMGHSLGGALAIIAASWLSHAGYTVDTVYTWGNPRVGNKKFAEDFNSRIKTAYRVTREYDPVPFQPERYIGYHHVATEVYYNTDNTHYRVCDGSGEDPYCSLKFRKSRCLLLPDITCAANWIDHSAYMNTKMFCEALLPPWCHNWYKIGVDLSEFGLKATL